MTIDDFPLRTYEKLRYVDTDRQGHVNNAVFASMLETGRVELLYNPHRPLADQQCSFVIARLTLDLHAEITWPGRVDIGTRAGKIGRSSITLEQGLFQNGQHAATASTVIVHVSAATRRSQAFSDVARQAFEALL
ncbi:thioesterase family protein [Accumulibacter sp.]|uniref:acyl-CoA thioesterase n=1 Tax=Accumulibacter sp. TaxID=2053492 RepID=UPI00262452B1|nr:thioesterase family protein [Accumulibacter sp.]